MLLGNRSVQPGETLEVAEDMAVRALASHAVTLASGSKLSDRGKRYQEALSAAGSAANPPSY
jgi:hypothetical protein